MRTSNEIKKLKTEKLAIVTDLQSQINYLLDQVNDGYDRPENIKKFRDVYSELQLEKSLIMRLERDLRISQIYELLTGERIKKLTCIEAEKLGSELLNLQKSEPDIPELLNDKINEELERLRNFIVNERTGTNKKEK
jgi:hypothetical protein